MLIKKIPKRSIFVFPREINVLLSFFRNKKVTKGFFLNKFESRFKDFVGSQEAIAVSSGRCALYSILRHLGLRSGDKILVCAYNFKGVPQLLAQEGFNFVFVDVHLQTYHMDIEEIEKKIDRQTKAILITHLFGHPCDINRILPIARKYNLFIIEDAAQSLGSYYGGKHTGTFGDAGFFSLTGSKIINTSFGGVIVTNNKTLAARIRKDVSNYASPSNITLLRERLITYVYAIVTNRTIYSLVIWPLSLLLCLLDLDLLEIYKKLRKTETAEKKMQLSELQAAIGLDQMSFFNNFITERKRIARIFIDNLDSHISLQQCPTDGDPNYFMIAIRAKDKQKVFKKLLFRGVDTNFSYACDCSSLIGNIHMANAQRLSNEILTINLPFDLTEKEAISLANILNAQKEWFY